MPAISLKRRLRNLAAEIPEDKVVREALQTLQSGRNKYADHAIAMISSSLVDKALEVAILAHFRASLSDDERKSIFEYEKNGPLADFSARIKIADALSIIGPKTVANLGHIRIVRNTFAHAPSLISFAHPSIAEACACLHTSTDVTIQDSADIGDRSRSLYIEVSMGLAARLKQRMVV